MAVSQTAEYALRAVIWLAHNPERPQTTQQIAEATRVSSSYLSKVLQPLSRSGYLSAQRGMHGGYTLVTDPAALRVLDVIECVDPTQRHAGAASADDTNDADETLDLSPLRHLLEDATAAAEQRFAGTTIADLLRRADPARSLFHSSPADTLLTDDTQAPPPSSDPSDHA